MDQRVSSDPATAANVALPRKVLIVDDSATARGVLRHKLGQDPRLQVVGCAPDPYEARRLIKALKPDVLTLDVEMPRMDGLEFLERLMRLRPMPVVMVSSLTKRGSDAAVAAMALGAFDCIAKADDPQGAAEQICESVYFASLATPIPLTEHPSLPGDVHQAGSDTGSSLILIGASTGGVSALEAVISNFPRNAPPVVIAQHMPAPFLQSFAARLNRLFPQDIGLAKNGDILRSDQIVLAPGGGINLGVSRSVQGWECSLCPADPALPHCPSIDFLFKSASANARDVSVVLMTGLGKDGARGMRQLKDRGATTVAQDEASCVVYGMPKAAKNLGCVDIELEPSAIAGHLFQRRKLSGASAGGYVS